MSDELEDTFGAIRIFLARYYPGEELEEVHLRLRGGQRLVLPAPRLAAARPRPRRRQARHSSDFRSIDWYGQRISLTAEQAAVIEQLWRASDNGTPDVAQARLLEDAHSDAKRLRDLFRRSEAWGVLIVPGLQPGTYRLAEAPPGEID